MIIAVLVVIFAAIIYQKGLSFLSIFSSGNSQNLAKASGGDLAPPFNNGTYTGSVANAFYGNIQVQG